jgi:hypothetical protein
MSSVPTRAREARPPRIESTRRRGVIRVGIDALTGPKVCELSDAEYRGLTILWAWVARYGEGGEIPRDWLRHVVWTGKGGRRRCITTRTLQKFIDFELVEEHEYVDDGSRVLVVANWREFRPADLTSAERKRRYRRRLYAGRFHGTLGEVAQIVVPPVSSPAMAAASERINAAERELIAATEALGQLVWEELEHVEREEIAATIARAEEASS